MDGLQNAILDHNDTTLLGRARRTKKFVWQTRNVVLQRQCSRFVPQSHSIAQNLSVPVPLDLGSDIDVHAHLSTEESPLMLVLLLRAMEEAESAVVASRKRAV